MRLFSLCTYKILPKEREEKTQRHTETEREGNERERLGGTPSLNIYTLTKWGCNEQEGETLGGEN